MCAQLRVSLKKSVGRNNQRRVVVVVDWTTSGCITSTSLAYFHSMCACVVLLRHLSHDEPGILVSFGITLRRHYASGDVSVAMAAHAMANVASAGLWLKKNDVELR